MDHTPLASNRTLWMDFTASGGGEGGVWLGGLLNVMLDIIKVKSDQGVQAKIEMPASCTGATALTVTEVDFGRYERWFTLKEALPIHLIGSSSDRGPTKTGSIAIRADPPDNAQPGNYTVPVEVIIQTVGGLTATTKGYIHLSVITPPRAIQQALGVIPIIVGYALGMGLLIAIGVALWTRH